MLDSMDIVLRLTAATLVGSAIGLDRDLRGKPTGVRTMGIVALGSALIVMASQYPAYTVDQAAASRVMQGIVTGIGFLGAGVILRNPGGGRIHGLTTAAAIWLTACMGCACGAGAWFLVLTSGVLVAAVLAFGKRLEQTFERRFPHDGPDEEDAQESFAPRPD
ncbi:MAG: MgtC/SapB family protein [Rhodomicrobium sp.]